MTPQESAERARVVACAERWLRTPWHHLARVKGVGVDCAQLLAAVYEEAGLIPHVETGHYPPDFMLHRGEERYLGWILKFARPVESPLPGDVVLYRWGRCLAHGAIVVEWPRIIHAFLGQGVVWGEGDQGRLADRERRFYTLWPRD